MIRVRSQWVPPVIWSGRSKLAMGSGGPPPPPPSPEAAQYFSRLSTPLSPPVQTIASTMIDALVAGGLWASMDIIRCPFLPMVQADALINLKASGAPGNAATEVNAPTWAAKVGYTFNGTTQYIDEGFSLSGGGVSYQLNSACFGVDIRAYTSASDTTRGSGSRSTSSQEISIFPRHTGDTMTGRIHNANLVGTGSFNLSAGVGFFTINRSTSTAAQVYRNGVAGMTSGNLSSGVSTRTPYIGAFNNNGAVAGHHAATYASWFYTNSKSAANQLTIYNAFNDAYVARQST